MKDDQAHESTDNTPGLVIGVTGHRTVDPENPRLRETVAHELERLRRTAQNPNIVVMSCLAEGADRLVADLGLDYLGAELIATLPMPPEDYRKDFESETSQQRFDELLGAAGRVVVVKGESSPQGGYEGPSRTLQYARAGAFIVERCDVLIALWDGEPARGIGGTGQLVDWMIAGKIPPEFASRSNGGEPIPISGSGLVVHIDPVTRDVAYLGD